ncbi:MAG: hypothetical protein CVU57_15010 [Deltaproteobacteria bacterium HGW-Deltaproteobacteria-15]|jgi:CelD/BcsL family acetyltransferase involved in cellulose biosynthesis|nr:MAG: hypothetical protein CVU57_15010 [Deltaproteobacteria bacterium HGW-Deltaproteobacteria-15]
MHIEKIDDFNHLSSYSDSWNKLAFDAPQKLPTLSYAWVASFYEHMLLPGESWLCLMAMEGEELVGVLPVVISPHRVFGLKRPNIMAPHNSHTFSVDFLAAGGIEHQVLPALLDSLLQLQPNAFGFFLDRLTENSPTLSVLKSELKHATIVKEFNGFGSYLKIAGSFEDYRNRLDRKFTKNLTRRRKKLSCSTEICTENLSGPDANKNHLARFMKLESSGWKGRSGTAIELSPPLVSFYSTLISRLSRLGWLEWHFLSTGDRTVAGSLAVKMDRTLVGLKIGYDEEFSTYSPGHLLIEQLIERAFREQDIDEINAVTDMAWNAVWGMDKRPHFNLCIYPNHPLSFIFGAMRHRGKLGLKRLPAVPSIVRNLRSLQDKQLLKSWRRPQA